MLTESQKEMYNRVRRGQSRYDKYITDECLKPSEQRIVWQLIAKQLVERNFAGEYTAIRKPLPHD